MTTTQNRNSTDFYTSSHACDIASRSRRVQTNPRYRNFQQNHFTAGDEEQFQQYRDATNGDICMKEIDISTNLFVDQPFDVWDKYTDIPATAVVDTFRYIFNKFKKGIFVKIKDGKVVVFLPFSKSKFINEWSSEILIDPKFKSLDAFLQSITGKGYRYNNKTVNHDMSEWYANNCIVRYDVAYGTQLPNEGDTNVGTVKHMLEELCANREIPDIEFFMNRRDFPILTRNGTEPYDGIWGNNKPLVSHNYDKYIPILSMCKTSNYADVLSPTHEDWARVQSKKGRWFPRSCREYNERFDMPWGERKETAVFRGASTGCGVTIDTNPRLKLAYISATTETKEGEIPLLDAGITKWNTRPRKLSTSPYLQSIDITNIGFDLVSRLTMVEQSTYKYIVNVDGHVSAFRLSIELGMGSVILLAKSQWKMWYSDMLVPYEHYVPVNDDLSDLLSQIRWCRDNDEKCQQIVLNATTFFNTYIQEDGILDYLQKTIVDMKSEMGVYLYNTQTPLSHQLELELQSMTLSYPETTKDIMDVNEIPSVRRGFGLLQGVHQVLNMAQDKGKLFDVLHEQGTIFSNKLGIIKKYTLGGKNGRTMFPVAIKRTTDPRKKREHIHEAFVGTKAINGLLKFIPNFAYTFGLHRDEEGGVSVINEFITGITLFEYLNSDSFKFDEYLFIILQICLAIQMAQQHCALVHYDLVPWNIILHRLRKPVIVDYVLDHKKVIRLRTHIIPVIIDYGKSHVIVDGQHHGFIDMFNVSTIQDMLSILLKSLGIIREKQRVSKNDFSSMLKTANFVAGTKYRPKEFTGAQDLRKFLQVSSSYTSLISDPKYELEEQTPKDLFNYIIKTSRSYKYSFLKNIGTTPVYKSFMDHGNSRQIFEYIMSSTVEEQGQSYFNVFSRLKHCTIPQPDNLFLVYYTVQSLYQNLQTVNEQMTAFLGSTSKSRPGKMGGSQMSLATYKKAYSGSISFLEQVYRPKLKKLSEQQSVEQSVEYTMDGDFTSLIKAPYTEETFLVPSRVRGLLPILKKCGIDLSSYQEIITCVLLNNGPYHLETKDVKHYLKNFDELLSTNPLYMKNNAANGRTLYNLAEKVYNDDLIMLKTKISKCSSIEKFTKDYINLLKEIALFI